MREPCKTEVARAVIALIDLESYVVKGWNIPKKTAKLIEEVINDLRFQYQFLD